MTAQLALINQLGIAMASDTLTSRHENSGDTKTYPASSKMFEVGPNHKVVVAHCGTTVIGRAHWRMLMSEWTLSLKDPLPSVEAYVGDFIEWLESNAPSLHFDEASMVSDVLSSEFISILSEDFEGFQGIVKAFEDSGKTADVASFERKLEEKLSQVTRSRYDGRRKYDDFTKSSGKKLLSSLKVNPIEVFRSVLLDDDSSVTFSSNFGSIIEGLALSCLEAFDPSNIDVSLNFVGFGTQERLGRNVTLDINSFYGGKLRCKISVFGDSDPKAYPAWHVFAQREAIMKFLTGMDSNLRDLIMSSAYDAIIEDAAIKPQADVFIEKISKGIDARLQENYVTPMMATLGALGIGGLTRLADMLVRMEALRSASLEGEATVGGYVESLSITRSDGVVWHRRMSVDIHSLEDSTNVFA